MRRSVERSIAKTFPDLSQGKYGLFYETPAAHVVTGFACDLTPTFLRVYHVHMPLYDLSSGTHLTYSETIFDEVRKELTGPEALDQILTLIAQQRTLKNHLFFSVDDVLKMIEDDIENLPRYLMNPPYRKAYATTLIMLGRFEEAEHHLCEIQKNFGYSSEDVVEDVNKTLKSLSDGKKSVILYRQKVKEIMIDRMGIDRTKCANIDIIPN